MAEFKEVAKPIDSSDIFNKHHTIVSKHHRAMCLFHFLDTFQILILCQKSLRHTLFNGAGRCDPKRPIIAKVIGIMKFRCNFKYIAYREAFQQRKRIELKESGEHLVRGGFIMLTKTTFFQFLYISLARDIAFSVCFRRLWVRILTAQPVLEATSLVVICPKDIFL